ncbi:unnamed protein product [Acanthoscelides obtectus]|uniref:Uncharacterized protein n=1 Tax=Acanthoscelides obtectus TaxID=200917 RepID=A0A9P0LKN5_ACAOB|nr:unnamed protein product [Acanthoscelides obtectus]CAK1633350.1 hypothetical protein AOBTE_LOCUS8064 [Acanthoscelides obtectus]
MKRMIFTCNGETWRVVLAVSESASIMEESHRNKAIELLMTNR